MTTTASMAAAPAAATAIPVRTTSSATAVAPPPASVAPTGPGGESTAGSGGTPKEAAPDQPPLAVTATPSPTPTPPATAVLASLEVQTPPRDLVALAERLHQVNPFPAMATPVPVDHPVGYEARFSVADALTKRYFTMTATVRVKTAHAYFYVQNDLPYDAAGLRQAAQTFEAKIYPTDVRIFGLPREPAIDGDQRISIVNADVPGVGGYFSASDEYPRAVIPYSNERNAIYINTKAEAIGSTFYLSTLAHELQHMIHWNVRPHDDSWVNEGMSMLAENLNGYPVGSVVPLFLSAPDVQLDAWSAEPAAAVPHYGAAYLFLDYFLQRFGGPPIVKELLASRAPDLAMFANFLTHHAPGVTLDDIFSDWVAANELNDLALDHGRYGYADMPLHATTNGTTLPSDQAVDGTVHQYAARYYTISPAAAHGTLQFQGTPTVPLMKQTPSTGLEWWSNRADTMDTTLTRSVDLRHLAKADLQFSLWMDIEDSYDYFYVEASRDGGQHWTTLPGTHSTTANPNGQNYGNGYTGKSADGAAEPGWWQEQVDLTPFAGSQILLHFEYVTDEAYSGPGVGLRDIKIPALDFDDTAADHRGWTSAGWLLTDNRVPEHFIVQLISPGAQATVIRVPLDAQNHGMVSLDQASLPAEPLVVAVSALAPKTSEVGTFTLSLVP